MRDQNWHYEGPWKGLENTAAGKQGSIHDDEPARRPGFRGAFVPGTVVGSSAMPAILERFGSAWFEGGWYDLNFVAPVYTSDRVRTTAAVCDEGITCDVQTDDDRLCCAGRAGLGYQDPWNSAGGPEHIFPDAGIGQTFEENTLQIAREHVQPMLQAAGDESACWQTLIHPQYLMGVALRTVHWKLVPTVAVRAPGMWAGHAIKIARPMPYGRYRVNEYLAEKGMSGRTNFVNFQLAVFDDRGDEVAVGRHKCKFIREDA